MDNKMRLIEMRKKTFKRILNIVLLAFALFCAFNAGRNYESGYHWGVTVLHLVGALGWISAYIQLQNINKINN